MPGLLAAADRGKDLFAEPFWVALVVYYLHGNDWPAAWRTSDRVPHLAATLSWQTVGVRAAAGDVDGAFDYVSRFLHAAGRVPALIEIEVRGAAADATVRDLLVRQITPPIMEGFHDACLDALAELASIQLHNDQPKTARKTFETAHALAGKFERPAGPLWLRQSIAWAEAGHLDEAEAALAKIGTEDAYTA